MDDVVSVDRRPWRAVLAREGVVTGDNRLLAVGSVSWRNPPLPLMVQFASVGGHDGAVPVGSIDRIWREDDGTIMGEGLFGTNADSLKTIQYLEENLFYGVSIDLTEASAELSEDETVLVFTSGKIGGATIVSIPAFEDTPISLLADGGLSDVVSFVSESTFTFSARPMIPSEPPAEWFVERKFDAVTPVVVEKSGRIFGHVAEWELCHISFNGVCRKAFRGAGLKRFMNKSVLCDDGSEVKTGVLFMNTDHAGTKLSAQDANQYYANTGCAVADVVAYEDEFGLAIVGALRPDVSDEQFRAAKGSDWSPDWRNVKSSRSPKGKWEVVGILAVNTSGLPSERNDSLVASGGYVSSADAKIGFDASGPIAIVGAGIVCKVTSFDCGCDIISNVVEDDEVEDMPELNDMSVKVGVELDEASLTVLSAAIENAVKAGFAAGVEAAKGSFAVESDPVETGESAVEGVADGAADAEDLNEFDARLKALEDLMGEVGAFIRDERAVRELAAMQDEFGDLFN